MFKALPFVVNRSLGLHTPPRIGITLWQPIPPGFALS